jgi:hypothetical protein
MTSNDYGMDRSLSLINMPTSVDERSSSQVDQTSFLNYDEELSKLRNFVIEIVREVIIDSETT